MAFSVSPFITDCLIPPIATHFVDFHWPTTPYNANLRIWPSRLSEIDPAYF